VLALTTGVKAGNVKEVLAIFGPDAQELVDSSDAVTARRNREVFTVAVAERWRLIDQGTDAKTLVIGHEEWPFPVPLARDGKGWRFDTAAGKEEVLARRIGRNELAAMRICRTYVAAQRSTRSTVTMANPRASMRGRSGAIPGSRTVSYWPAARRQKRSPLGNLLAEATEEGRSTDRQQPSPFHGYYFRILTAQGPAAPGGAKDYIAKGGMSGGFALVAWPAQYDVTGIMTFVVNQDGIVREKDLGPGTDGAAKTMSLYNPDGSWEIVQ
jgi:hypothetical protein